MGRNTLGDAVVAGIAAGFITGILSGCGVGGGSLLMLWLTIAENIAQAEAAGINLLYFIFCSPPALVSHYKNHLIIKEAFIRCSIIGCLISPAASLLALSISSDLLRQCFGILLIIIGTRELFHKKTDAQ